MGSIYLIRHGQASFGAENYDVLPLGYRQSEALGDYLAQLGVSFDRCPSGELDRQQDTARATLARLGPQPDLEIDAAFNEFHADAVIRAHLPDLLKVEPNAMHILRNAADHRADFQRLFTYVVHRWISGEHEKDELESWQHFACAAGWNGCSNKPASATALPSSRPAEPLPRCCTDHWRTADQGLRDELADRQHVAQPAEVS